MVSGSENVGCEGDGERVDDDLPYLGACEEGAVVLKPHISLIATPLTS